MMMKGAWGPPGGGKGGYGAWGAPGGGWDSNTPYEDPNREANKKAWEAKEKKKKEEEAQQAKWDERNRGPFPYTNWLFIPDTAKEVQQGFPQTIPAIEYNKDKEIFSDSHKILQYFFDQLLGDVCTFEQDWDGSLYPEIMKAWKQADNFDNTAIIAKCSVLKLWAAGFGSKDKGLRAAKLALALSVANISAPHTVERVVQEYPAFSQFCLNAYNTGANGGSDQAAWATGRLS